MEHEKPPPYVQYHSNDPSIRFVEPEGAPSPAPLIRSRRCRCTATRCLVSAVTIFLMAAVAALSTLLFLGRFEPSPKAGHLRSTGLHGITNLSVVGVDNRYVTMTWNKPLGDYDFYLVGVTGESGKGYSRLPQHYAGSCANGTIVRAEQTQITCGPFPPCSSITFTVSTFSKGPPEHISMGATLKDVFVSGKDPSKPGGITMVPKSPYTTQIQWEPPPSLDGTIDVYKVTVCEKSTTCGDREKLTGCVEHEVSETWLDFGSTADTTYCVLVSASSRCGVNVLIGPPAVQEITTPLFELPDVNNLNLVAVDNNYITVAWDQPRDSFDFYWLDVTDGDGNKNGSPGKLRVGTCRNGTIIRPEQTQISCGPFDACSSVSITVHTYSKGPPELVSTGTTLNYIFIGGKEPSEPRSLTMLAESPSTTRFQWERPASFQGTFHGYKLQVCKMFKTCTRKDTLDGCVEYETSDSWMDVDTTPDTQYCVLVTAAARCGRNVLYSAPVTRGVKTPLFALPDVSNLSVAVVKSGYITLSWQRPRGRVDHYTVEVIEHAAGIARASQNRHGSCANVIIRPDQTELTCGPFEPCTNLSGTIRTHVNGPPDHSSPGASVIGIFIPLEDPSPPTNITMTAESASRTLLQWSPPEENSGVIESYSLKICKTLGQCEKAETLSDCADYVTKETRAVFDSKEDSSYCVLIKATTRCGTEQISSRQATLEIRTPIFDLPSVTNFRLLSAANKSVTVAWERPEVRFDFYWVSISTEDETHHGSNASSLTGSCSNGTIIHPDKTRVTCTNLEACATVNIILRTHRNGPPKHTSDGVSLRNIFIPGEEPDPPRNISIEGKSPSSTRLHWEPPSKAPGRFHGYGVKVCASFDSCSGEASLSDCTELQTHDSWLDFASTVDTTYCVLVTTISMCGEHVLTGRPAIAEIRTPLLDLSDVSNFVTTGVKNRYVTLSWSKPQGRFDYYSIEATDSNAGSRSNERHKLGLCTNGTIVHPDRTQITCGPYEPCSNLSFTIYTHFNVPPRLMSPGMTLKGIVIPAEEPHPPRNLTMIAEFPYLTRLHWDSPDTLSPTVESYTVKICRTFMRCTRMENMRDCTESVTSVRRTTFNSTADTAYCVLLTANTRCGNDEVSSRALVEQIRTPLLVAPEVTNLRLERVGPHFFTAAWERPKVSIDYYTIETTDSDSGQPSVEGSCASGTIIHRNQARVTCGPLKNFRKVSFKVRTHINGPPALTSTGVMLKEILIPDSVPEEVGNLKLGTVEADAFTLTWTRPKACFDYYRVEVIDESSGGITDVKCNKGALINPSQDSVSCEQPQVCANVTVRVKVVTRGPPEWSSPGTTLRHILLLGKAPTEVTNVRLATVIGGRFTITLQAPDECLDAFHGRVHAVGNRLVQIPYKSCFYDHLGYSRWNITCDGVQACGKVDFEVGARKKGPPYRDSPGVTVRGINIRGNCRR